VFYLGGAVYLFGTIFYLIFGSGEVQPWAIQKKPEEMEGLDNTTKETLARDAEGKENEKETA